MLTVERLFPDRDVRRWAAVVAAVAVSIGVAVTPFVAPAAVAADAALYVAPDGSDSANGSFSAPFRTIEHARDVVRSMNSDMSGDITVYLRGGTYPVDSTIDFGVEDSGKNGHRVTYSAYQNEVPVLEAGTPVTGWTRHDGNIWQAPLTRADKLRALYIDGTRYSMASKTVQSQGCYGNYTVTAGQAPWAWESGTECDGSAYALQDVPAISRNASDMELTTATTWSTAITGIREVTTSTDGSQRVLLFQQPGAAIAQAAAYAPLQPGGTHVLSNAYEFLDQPGEFFFDREAQTVYVYKDAASDLSTASVFAPNNVETVLAVNGNSTTDRVHDLTFTGLTIRHSDWNLTQIDGSSFKQTQQGNTVNVAFTQKNFHDYTYRNILVEPGAVEVNSAANIDFVRNRVEHTGAGGIQYINDVVDSRIDGNVTNDIGGSAINIGDPQHVYIGDGTPSNGEHYAPGVEGAPTRISVRDNYIYDSAVLFWGSAAISGYFLDTVAIDNNRIEKTAWAGISLGWGWWNFDGLENSVNPGNPTDVAKDNSIQHNEILDTMRFLNDSGPIYTLGKQPNTIIDDNYARGIRPGHTYGLHPDEGSAFITYSDNVIEADPGIAYVINSGTWGRQHDLQMLNTWGPNNKIFDRNVPNSTIQDIRVVPDFVWPAEPQGITVAAGIAPEYRDILGGIARTADFALPASALVTESTTSIPIRGVGDAARTLWLAPAGTTAFAAGATMASAPGDATTIPVPTQNGTYKLFVVDSDGTVSTASTATVVRTAPAPRNETLKNVAAGKCLDLPGATRQNGARPALWDCLGDANQQFTYTDAGELRVYGEKCLDASGGGATAGTAVILWDCSGAPNQKWTLNDDKTIRSAVSGLCLAIADGRTDSGGPAIIDTCTDSSAQQWEFPVSEYTVPTEPEPEPTPTPTGSPEPTPTSSSSPEPTSKEVTASSATVRSGESVRVTVVGLAAGEQVRAELRSDPIMVTGIPQADAAGRVSFDVRVPITLPLGSHTIVVFDGAGVEIARLPLTVVAASAALASTGTQASWMLAVFGGVLLLVGAGVVIRRGRRAH